MEEKEEKNGFMVVSAVLSLLTIIGIVANGYLILGTEIPALVKASTTVNLVGLLAMMIYCSSGYRKESAFFYKIFLFMYGISFIFLAENNMVCDNIMISDSFVSSYLNVVFVMFEFSCCFTLFLAKDLGKVKSLSLAGIMVGIIIVQCIMPLCLKTGEMETMTVSEILIRYVGTLIGALLIFASTVAKYKDKKDRGTK